MMKKIIEYEIATDDGKVFHYTADNFSDFSGYGIGIIPITEEIKGRLLKIKPNDMDKIKLSKKETSDLVRCNITIEDLVGKYYDTKGNIYYYNDTHINRFLLNINYFKKLFNCVKLSNKEKKEILQAMDDHVELANYLFKKLKSEIKKIDISEMQRNNMYEYELSENWFYWTHGHHCRFRNRITNQEIEVCIFGKTENLDPYFFYSFINTSEKYKYLAKYFEKNPFGMVKNIFEQLIKKNKMEKISEVEYRKINKESMSKINGT